MTGAGTTGNEVLGNFIGTDVRGTADLGNALDGVIIAIASNNTVGGAAPGARNVISGNNRHGVTLNGLDTMGNAVRGNFIGTDASGTADLGNALDGVNVSAGADHNSIGGATAGARNVISGNGRNGVLITDAGTNGIVVEGNVIGVAANGTTALGNGSHGVFVANTASANLIGGLTAGTGNVIAHNRGAGVLIGSDPVFTTPGENSIVLGNSIFANGGLGIDLGTFGSVTPNDAGDVDTGPNGLLNFPVLSAALLEGDDLLVIGSINTQANSTLRIEFFVSPAADPGGNGEGQTFLGFVEVTMGNSTTVSFSA